jgi:hypothetical protein
MDNTKEVERNRREYKELLDRLAKAVPKTREHTLLKRVVVGIIKNKA